MNRRNKEEEWGEKEKESGEGGEEEEEASRRKKVGGGNGWEWRGIVRWREKRKESERRKQKREIEEKNYISTHKARTKSMPSACRLSVSGRCCFVSSLLSDAKNLNSVSWTYLEKIARDFLLDCIPLTMGTSFTHRETSR